MTDVTRGEFDMLRDMVAANVNRLDAIDQGGTRGVGIVQSQLVDLAKDVASLSAKLDKDVSAVNDRLDSHLKDHRAEARDRAVSRRWAVGMAVALIGPLYPLLLLVVGHH